MNRTRQFTLASGFLLVMGVGAWATAVIGGLIVAAHFIAKFW